jgi:Sel1 repeat
MRHFDRTLIFRLCWTITLAICLSSCATPNPNPTSYPITTPSTGFTQGPPTANDLRAAVRANKAKDYATALPLFEKVGSVDTSPASLPGLTPAFLDDIAWARLHVGLYYENGFGVQQNYENAILWYQYASQTPAPNSIAIDNVKIKLGLFYYYGIGVRKDIPFARTLVVDGEYGMIGSTNWAYLMDYGLMPRSADEGLHIKDVRAIAENDRRITGRPPALSFLEAAPGGATPAVSRLPGVLTRDHAKVINIGLKDFVEVAVSCRIKIISGPSTALTCFLQNLQSKY